MRRRDFLAAALLLPALPVWAALREGGRRRAVEIVDGDTLVLDNGREVRLVGTQAPKLPLGRRNFPTWPLADEAKAALAELAAGQDLALRFGGQDEDRHGRILAHLYRVRDGVWLQGEMLRRGMARVYTFADNRALAGEMLALERAARGRRAGIWGHPYYRIRAADDARELSQSTDTFQLVEGRILEVGRNRERTFLNFGPDWRTDFTVAIARDSLRALRAGGVEPDRLAGREVRVRGWLRRENGPMMDLTHPEQIELEP